MPHIGTIVANTSAGYGEPTNVIVFSQEGGKLHPVNSSNLLLTRDCCT